jgi:hypothetical protein
MILSRVIQHMKSQHWTAIFIDFLIVVVGVFIGMQVNNWNVTRQDRTLEKQYLHRLRNDLRLSLNKENFNVSSMGSQAHLEGEMAQALTTCHLDPSQKSRFAAGMFLFGQFEPPPLVRGTIDELRSTGRLGLLQDVRLRQNLGEVLQLDEANKGVLQMIVMRATPDIAIVDQNTLLTRPEGGFDWTAIRQGKVKHGSVKFDFHALCKDPRVAASVSAIQRMTNVVIEQNQHEAVYFKALVQIINQDLGKLH